MPIILFLSLHIIFSDPHYDFVTCKEGYTRCDNGYECILDSDVCDGITEHCSDNSDERGCGKITL